MNTKGVASLVVGTSPSRHSPPKLPPLFREPMNFKFGLVLVKEQSPADQNLYKRLKGDSRNPRFPFIGLSQHRHVVAQFHPQTPGHRGTLGPEDVEEPPLLGELGEGLIVAHPLGHHEVRPREPLPELGGSPVQVKAHGRLAPDQ